MRAPEPPTQRQVGTWVSLEAWEFRREEVTCPVAPVGHGPAPFSPSLSLICEGFSRRGPQRPPLTDCSPFSPVLQGDRGPKGPPGPPVSGSAPWPSTSFLPTRSAATCVRRVSTLSPFLSFFFSLPRALPAQGPPGDPGKPGAPGKPGTPGADVSSGNWGRSRAQGVCACACREAQAAGMGVTVVPAPAGLWP